MQSHRKRLRALRHLAIVGCVASLAVPAAAGATIGGRPATPPAKAPAATAYVPDESGARLDHRGLHETSPLLGVNPRAHSWSVTREVGTTTWVDGHAFAIVLASVALGVALCGSGYVALGLARIQRRVVANGS
jgi:hypothetical protein